MTPDNEPTVTDCSERYTHYVLIQVRGENPGEGPTAAARIRRIVHQYVTEHGLDVATCVREDPAGEMYRLYDLYGRDVVDLAIKIHERENPAQ